MLSHEDLTIPRKSIIVVVVLCAALLIVNHFTGIFTRVHLENEESLVMHHGVDTQLYDKMLTELISDTGAEEHWERRIAAIEIGHLGSGALRAAPALQKLLEDDNSDVRYDAAIALARIGSHSAQAVETLIEVLKNGSDHDRFLAVNALGLIGAEAKAAIPQLTIESREGHPDVRSAAGVALKKLGADPGS